MEGLGEGIFRLFFFSIPGMVIVGLIFPVEFSAILQLGSFFQLQLSLVLLLIRKLI